MNAKIYLVLPLLLAACSKSEQDSQDPQLKDDNLIVFSVNGSRSEHNTRGTIVGYYDDMKERDISVTALLPDNSEYFGTEQLSFVDLGINPETGEDLGYWETANKYYWPVSTLSFFALMPYSDDNRSSSGPGSFTYTVPHDNAQQTDLMYAYSKNVATGSDVQLNFKHALATLSFSAKANQGISVTIEYIEVCNVVTQATFNYPTVSTEEQSESVSTAGSLCTWTNLGSATGKVTAGIESIPLTTTINNITPEDGKLMMIPQSLTAWNTADGEVTRQAGSYLIIHCRLMSAGLYFAGTDTTYGQLYVPFSGSFEAGQQYVVNLLFGMGYNSLGEENKIKIDVSTTTIVDWSQETISYDNKTL